MWYQGILGIVAFMAILWALSENRRAINYRTTLIGLGVQVILAFAILKSPQIQQGFTYLTRTVSALREATIAGTSFVFGTVVGGGDLPFAVIDGKSTFSFAFQALPMLMVVSALSMLFFKWGILPVIVRGLSFCLRKTLGIGGALGLCGAAKVFLGQTDAPLLIRPYLSKMSRSEIFTIMCLGMATTAGTIMALYAAILEPAVPHVMGHLITASIISVPGAIILSRLLVPQVGADTDGTLNKKDFDFSSSMEAVAHGTSEGLKMFLNIIAMLIVFIALVSLVNKILGLIPHGAGAPYSLQGMLGILMAPLAWLMGIPWSECTTAGGLLGTKTVMNEIFAFLDLTQAKDLLSERSRVIMTYGLCGFANISSVGIVIGSLGTLVPEKRHDIISLGFKAVLVGTLSTCLSGTLVGLIGLVG